MITNVKVEIPKWYLFTMESALLCFFLGTAIFILEMIVAAELLKDFFGETTASEILTRPIWASAVFAITSFCGLIGCILILMQYRLAVIFFIISFLTSLIEQLYWWFILKIGNSLQGFDWMWPVIIPIISLSLLLLSIKGLSRGWLH